MVRLGSGLEQFHRPGDPVSMRCLVGGLALFRVSEGDLSSAPGIALLPTTDVAAVRDVRGTVAAPAACAGRA